MNKKDFKKFIIPDSPGVYFFLKGKKILYVGKATSLRDRVRSYFGNDLIGTRGPIVLEMVFQANNIKIQKTDSVLEALILEASLIKKYQPKYNTKEKSDKSFNYVCITKEEIPKVIIIREHNLQEKSNNFGKYTLGDIGQGTHFSKNHYFSPANLSAIFGPFPNSSQLKEALRIIRKIFPFLDEKSKNYLEFYKQINLVPDLNNKKLYRQNIKNIILFFSGKKQQILRNLHKEMSEYSKLNQFEKAGEIKRQIFALQHINDVSLIKRTKEFSLGGLSQADGPRVSAPLVSGDSDPIKRDSFGSFDYLFRVEAYDVAHMSGRNMVGVMTVIEDGEVKKSEYKKFKIKTQTGSNDTGALAEILERRLAHTEWQYPKLIVVDGGKAQTNTARKILSKYGIQIPVVSVLKNEHHKPKAIMGDKVYAKKYETEILLANSEAHRFAIAYHKNLRGRNFLK